MIIRTVSCGPMTHPRIRQKNFAVELMRSYINFWSEFMGRWSYLLLKTFGWWSFIKLPLSLSTPPHPTPHFSFQPNQHIFDISIHHSTNCTKEMSANSNRNGSSLSKGGAIKFENYNSKSSSPSSVKSKVRHSVPPSSGVRRSIPGRDDSTSNF